MDQIQRHISPFIAKQFPSFYQQEGPNFVAFVKAYYEWIEQSTEAVGISRSLLDYADVDKTPDEFLEHFRQQYVATIPETVVADKRLLIKHILDLYRSKGTKRAYELLFRMLFNEDIEIYIPGEYVFKASDNTWKVPRYIEVTSNRDLYKIAGRTIYTIGDNASAVVENVETKIINGRTINVIELSNIRGEFTYGQRITANDPTLFSDGLYPIIIGSLTAVAVNDGGFNYSVGDILDITGSGEGGKARVSSLRAGSIGVVQFILAGGGSGYTLNPVITVAPTLSLFISDPVGNFAIGENVVLSPGSANGIVVQANSSLLQLINFSTPNTFTIGAVATGANSAATATTARVIGGTGAGASFRVGSLVNREFLTINTETINPYVNFNLDALGVSFRVGISSVSGTFAVGNVVNSTANSVMLQVTPITSTFAAVGETFSNATLGISGLYVYRSDLTNVWCTGPEASLTSVNLVTGAELVSSVSSSRIRLVTTPNKETITGLGTISTSSPTSLDLTTVTGYFIPTRPLNNQTTGGTATISTVSRLTDWGFANSSAVLDNLDSVISQVAPFTTLETGTIGSLTAINPGSGYATRPYVTVVEPRVVTEYIFDSDGSLKGNNAVIDVNVVTGNGVVSTVEVIDSGYGYYDNENITLRSESNEFDIRGTTILYTSGRGTGRWLNRKSFTSDLMKIYDGEFYQDFSYQIVAQRMFDSYEGLVRSLVHPAGLVLYGRYRSDSYAEDFQDEVSESSITQGGS